MYVYGLLGFVKLVILDILVREENEWDLLLKNFDKLGFLWEDKRNMVIICV